MGDPPKEIIQEVVALGCASMVAGCFPAIPKKPPESYVMQTAYNEADFVRYTGKGPGMLHGQAFLRTVGGEVRTCAGAEAVAMPATPYNYEFMREQYDHSASSINRNPAADQFTRKTHCNAQGDFAFSDLPLGYWIIAVQVRWGVPTANGIQNQGGLIFQSIEVKAGQNETLLTDKDAILH